jgi:hypothetical protein
MNGYSKSRATNRTSNYSIGLIVLFFQGAWVLFLRRGIVGIGCGVDALYSGGLSLF